MMKIMPVDQFDAEDFKTPPIQAGNEIEAAVDDIIRCVREKGDQALIDYAARFDRAIIDNVVVSDKEIEEAFHSCDPEFLETLRLARDNIEAFHSHQKRNSFTVCDENGKVLGQRIIPLRRVGLYVPGGTASYPSSVLMNALKTLAEIPDEGHSAQNRWGEGYRNHYPAREGRKDCPGHPLCR